MTMRVDTVAAPTDLGSLLLVLYECVTNPDRAPELIAMTASWLEEDDNLVLVPNLEQHAEQAWQMLTKFTTQADADAAEAPLKRTDSFHAIHQLHAALGDQLNAEDTRRLDEWVRQDPNTEAVLLIRIFSDQDDAPEIAMLTQETQGSFTLHRMAVDFADHVATFMCASFSLTRSETQVLSQLMVGGTLSEIAKRLGKSPETVRSQAKSLSEKLSANSQTDILRLANQAAVHLGSAPEIDPATQLPSVAGEVKTFRLSDGRLIDYELDNPQLEKTLIYFHGSGEGRHWTRTMKALAKAHGYRVLRVSRSGFGGSTVNEKMGLELLDAHVQDLCEILNAENIARAVLFSQEDGTAIAYRFALLHPDRANYVIAWQPFPPVLRRKDTKHLKGLAKSIMLTALFTPRLLSNLIRFAMRALAKRQVDEGHNSFTGTDFLQDGDWEMHQVELLTDRDLVAAKGEGMLRDVSFAVKDWTQAPFASNARPTVHILHCADFRFVDPVIYDGLRASIGAEVFEIQNHGTAFFDAMHWTMAHLASHQSVIRSPE